MSRLALFFVRNPNDTSAVIVRRGPGRLSVMPARLADELQGPVIGWYTRDSTFADIWGDLDA